MACAFKDKDRQDLSCLFAEWFLELEMLAYSVVLSREETLFHLMFPSTFDPLFFFFFLFFSFELNCVDLWCDLKDNESKALICLTSLHSLRSGARKLLEKYWILAHSESQIKYGKFWFWSLQKRNKLCSFKCSSSGGLSGVLSSWEHSYTKVKKACCIVVGWNSLHMHHL